MFLVAVTLVIPLAAILAEVQKSLGSEIPANGNAFTYLDDLDPFWVGLQFPKLTTPQWVGDAGVDAVVVLGIDDMTETGKYEAFLRPILDRLKQIDGRAPVSIMTRSVPPDDPQVQRWLKEGLSLEAHTLGHPCPLLAKGDFVAAETNYYGCIDRLNQIPGCAPVAFRMPCCDSMNSTSPRFFAELFNHASPKGNFLSIDSSVMNLLTTNDPALPTDLVMDSGGKERFRKYFPAITNATTRVSLKGFATTIENYPYPYVIGRLCWEFPCVVPSDWEASNSHGSTNQATVADWQAALDAVVLKRGVFTMVFHPYDWIRNTQMVSLIDYAATKYGKRVKFLTFREALERLNRNLLLGQSLRAADGRDNGIRLLDLNGDGFLDAVIGNKTLRTTRIWNPGAGRWNETDFPASMVNEAKADSVDRGLRFGLPRGGRQVEVFFRNEEAKGAWYFDGERWREDASFFTGLTLRGEPVLTEQAGRDNGVRLRDVDKDGQSELLVGNETQNAIFKWDESAASWRKLAFALPQDTSIVNSAGQDTGLRFVDINGDGYDDALISNQTGYSVHMFIAHAKQWLGWEVGWSYRVRWGGRDHPDAIPMIARGGAHPNNGAWFHSGEMWVQNEDTAGMPDQSSRVTFQRLLLGDEAPPKTPADALASFRLAPGYKIELVASEPLIVDPVAFDWGPDGKLWVVEMRDYPLGMDGKGKAGGTVVFLEDSHGDGRYDKSTVFLEGLNFPNGILPWRKGVLISAAPDIIYAEDTDGDGRADVRKVLYSGFREGNQQHRINGFEYGLDNWLYAANGGSGGVVRSVGTGQELNLRGHDLRLRPDESLMELQPGASQFGRHRNDWGDWFGNDNSRWLWHYFASEHYLARNPHLATGSLTRQLANYPDSSRVFAASRAQQRFNWPTQLFQVTSACSPTPYRDELLGPEFEQSVLICEPANNLIHREVLETRGASFTSHRGAGETNSEFLASTDNWSRPVMVKTGPDGALYFADMYRLVIEHPEYFPDELKQRPDLRAGDDKGRIYRIYPANTTLKPVPRLDKLDTAGLVAAMDSSNGWQRDTVQRLLVQSHSASATPKLETLIRQSPNPKARLQALATMAGFEPVSASLLASSLKDPHWAVRREALVVSEPRFGQSAELDLALLSLDNDPDVRVRYQMALSLGEWRSSAAGRVLGRLFLQDWQDEAMQLALLSSALPHLSEIVSQVFGDSAASRLSPSLAERLIELAAQEPDDKPLVDALVAVSRSQPGGYFTWQMASVRGFLATLDKRDVSLAQFKSQATTPLRQALDRLGPLFEQADRLALDPAAIEGDRLIAIDLLARNPTKQEQEELTELGTLLDPRNSTAIQNAALAALRGGHGPGVAEVLLRHWRSCGLNLRQQVLNILFSRPEWVEAVVTSLEQGKLQPGELGPLQRQYLLNNSDQGLRDRSARLFSAIDADRRKVVASYRTVGNLQADRARGHVMFTKSCAICHRLGGEGQNIGPDLGTVVDKPIQELVVAILDPNQAVDPAYTVYTAVTKDERELSGILIGETANGVSLRMPGGAEEQILRSDLKQFSSSGRSLMPEGFEASLKPQDLADLIAYLLNPRQ